MAVLPVKAVLVFLSANSKSIQMMGLFLLMELIVTVVPPLLLLHEFLIVVILNKVLEYLSVPLNGLTIRILLLNYLHLSHEVGIIVRD